MKNERRQATAVELAVVLMEAVCRTTSQEEDALVELAARLCLDAGRLRSELMFLRAFAVELAVELQVGAGAAGADIMTRYRQHWSRIDAGVPGVSADLLERCGQYARAARDPEATAGLPARVGHLFAAVCVAGANTDTEDLARFGAALFSAMYEELCRLFEDVDILPPNDQLPAPCA